MSRSEANHLQSGFVVQKIGEKTYWSIVGRVVSVCCFFVLGNAQKNAHFGWVIVRAILVFILKGYLWDCNLALALVASGLSADLLGNGFESILSEVVALKATPATTGIVRGCDHL